MRVRHVGRRLGAVLATLLIAAAPRLAGAQTDPRLEPGDRVRVTHTDPCCRSPQTGHLVSVGPDSIVLDTQDGPYSAWLALRRDRLRTLEYGRDVGSHALTGAVLGVLVGVTTTGVTLLAMSRGCEDICGTAIIAPFALPAGAAIGGFVGGLIGHSVRRIEWQRVALPVRVGVYWLPRGPVGQNR